MREHKKLYTLLLSFKGIVCEILQLMKNNMNVIVKFYKMNNENRNFFLFPDLKLKIKLLSLLINYN